MPRLPLELTNADVPRLPLALHAAHLGLADPTGPMREKGFEFHSTGTVLRISFRDEEIATYYTSGTSAGTLFASEDLPETAHAPLISLMARLRDTARRVDSMRRAERKAVVADIRAASATGPQDYAGITPEHLLRAAAAADALPGPVRLMINNPIRNTGSFWMGMRRECEAFPDSGHNQPYAFRYINGSVDQQGSHFAPSADFLRAQAEAAEPLMREAIAAFGGEAESAAEFTKNEIEAWTEACREPEAKRLPLGNGGWVSVGYEIASVFAPNGVLVLAFSPEGRAEGNGLALWADPLCPPGLARAMTHAAKDAMMTLAPLRDAHKRNAPHEEAARLLAETDFGYVF